MKKQINRLLVLLFLQGLTATALLARVGLIARCLFNCKTPDEKGNGHN